jgi:hypothetical protein
MMVLGTSAAINTSIYAFDGRDTLTVGNQSRLSGDAHPISGMLLLDGVIEADSYINIIGNGTSTVVVNDSSIELADDNLLDVHV